MNEIRELIAFYDERGWDWTDAVCFTAIKYCFGSWQELRDSLNPLSRRRGVR